VSFLLEAPRTGEEFFDWLAAEAQKPDALWAEADIQLAMEWAITATQKRGNNSVLALELKSIAADDEAFDGWTAKRLDCTLGPEAEVQGTPTAVGVAATNAPQGVDPLQMASAAGAGAALQVMQQMGTAKHGQTTQATTTSRTRERGTEYERMDIAVLMGWAGVTDPKKLPKIYGRWESTKNWVHHRQILYAKLEKWAIRHRWEAYLEPNLDIAESNMKDLVRLRPNPGTSIAIHQSAEKGCSILMCRPVTATQVEERQRRSAARARAEGTRTEGEVYDELSEGPRAPARTYYELLHNLVTFTGVVFVLYGARCDYYRKLYQLCDIMLMERVIKLRSKFTAMLCKEITWRVIDEGRDFFSRRMDLEDFRRGKPKFKRCVLHNIFEKVRAQENIYSSNFPTEWKPQTRTDLPPPIRPLPRPDGGSSPFGGGGRQQPPPNRNQQQNRQQWGRQGGGGQQQLDQQMQNLQIGHVNDRIKQFMTPYYRKFGSRVNFFGLLNAANIHVRDMPYLNKYMRGGQNMLCYNHLLGRCHFGGQCTRAEGHADKQSVPDDFADACIRVLTPGMDVVMRQLGTGGNRQRGGGQPGQRQGR